MNLDELVQEDLSFVITCPELGAGQAVEADPVYPSHPFCVERLI